MDKGTTGVRLGSEDNATDGFGESGAIDGFEDIDTIGIEEGSSVVEEGINECEIVGSSEGFNEGSIVGSTDGSAEGSNDGSTDGSAEGLEVAVFCDCTGLPAVGSDVGMFVD